MFILRNKQLIRDTSHNATIELFEAQLQLQLKEVFDGLQAVRSNAPGLLDRLERMVLRDARLDLTDAAVGAAVDVADNGGQHAAGHAAGIAVTALTLVYFHHKDKQEKISINKAKQFIKNVEVAGGSDAFINLVVHQLRERWLYALEELSDADNGEKCVRALATFFAAAVSNALMTVNVEKAQIQVFIIDALTPKLNDDLFKGILSKRGIPYPNLGGPIKAFLAKIKVLTPKAGRQWRLMGLLHGSPICTAGGEWLVHSGKADRSEKYPPQRLSTRLNGFQSASPTLKGISSLFDEKMRGMLSEFRGYDEETGSVDRTIAVLERFMGIYGGKLELGGNTKERTIARRVQRKILFQAVVAYNDLNVDSAGPDIEPARQTVSNALIEYAKALFNYYYNILVTSKFILDVDEAMLLGQEIAWINTLRCQLARISDAKKEGGAEKPGVLVVDGASAASAEAVMVDANPVVEKDDVFFGVLDRLKMIAWTLTHEWVVQDVSASAGAAAAASLSDDNEDDAGTTAIISLSEQLSGVLNQCLSMRITAGEINTALETQIDALSARAMLASGGTAAATTDMSAAGAAAGGITADVERMLSLLLHAAIMLGKENSVRDLLNNGAHWDMRDSGDDYTALHVAALFGNQKIFNLLLEQADRDAPTDLRVLLSRRDQSTVLHSAAFGSHVEIVRQLLDRGMLIDKTNGVHSRYNTGTRTALHMACRANNPNKSAVIKLLLERHASAIVIDHEQNLPLHLLMLSTVCDVEDCLALIEAQAAVGGNINRQNIDGNTALMEAVMLEVDLRVRGEAPNLEVINALLKAGADIRITNRSGCTPYDVVNADLEEATGKLERLQRELAALQNPAGAGAPDSGATNGKAEVDDNTDDASSYTELANKSIEIATTAQQLETLGIIAERVKPEPVVTVTSRATKPPCRVM